MPFGYAPDGKSRRAIVMKMLGYPSMIRRIQAPVIMRMIEPREREAVLDAGCGGGFFTYEIARRCRISVGVDWNLGKESSPITGNQHRLAYLRSDVQRLPFASEKFDKILLSSVLQMVKDDRGLLNECRRVLKRKGILVLSVPIEYLCLKRLNQLKGQLKKKFRALGKGYYELNEINVLLCKQGFKIIDVEYSPKKWGSFVFEVGLFLWYRFGFPFFNPLLFPLFYSIAYLDRFASRGQTGDEVIVSAWKV